MEKKVETQIVPSGPAAPPVLSPTFVLVLAAAAYALSLTSGFTFDDFAIFTAEPVTRPLTWLTFWLNRLAGGDNPFGFHAANLALHMTAVWLCRDTLSRVLPARAASIATALFALHPIQSEAVNYVWARATLLMTVLCLLSIRDWLRGRTWLAVLWFALALAAKEEAVALPLFFALLHLSISRNTREWRPIGVMLVMALASGLYVLRAANTIAGSQAGAQSVYTPLEYFGSQGYVILRYLALFVAPWRFTVDPEIPAGWWAAWLAILVMAGFAMTQFSRARAGFWILGALVLLLPSSSVFPANDLAADRRMYFPVAALAAALGLVLQRIQTRQLVLLAVVLASLTFSRTWVWNSNQRLWAEAVERAPGKLRPRVQLARALPPAQALEVLNEAKKIAPADAGLASELGRTFLSLNQPVDALHEFGRALALTPGNAQAIGNRGVALAMLKQDAAAQADFERALVMDPCAFEARLNLLRLGVRTEAPAQCRFTPEQQAALR